MEFIFKKKKTQLCYYHFYWRFTLSTKKESEKALGFPRVFFEWTSERAARNSTFDKSKD